MNRSAAMNVVPTHYLNSTVCSEKNILMYLDRTGLDNSGSEEGQVKRTRSRNNDDIRFV